MNLEDAYPLVLLAIAVWREARGELDITKQAVAWTIRNRVMNPRWWGHTWEGVILMPFQFSSFNAGDPNATKWPNSADPAWVDAFEVAQKVYYATPPFADPTHGAVSYFEDSLSTDPPKWAYDGSYTHTVDLGRLHFYKLAA
jgi:spore germination cell wall hydrolase CwlJ-like protein